uniref:Uncharacterized protein n=1 Tax=Aegilops tauschii subsp. strangulata TaxID=200361 RepID=A0A453I2C3_AEGTS
MEICSKDSFFLAYERSVSTGRMTEGAMTWILAGIITQEGTRRQRLAVVLFTPRVVDRLGSRRFFTRTWSPMEMSSGEMWLGVCTEPPSPTSRAPL